MEGSQGQKSSRGTTVVIRRIRPNLSTSICNVFQTVFIRIYLNTVHNCGDIKVIESCFIAMVILNALLTCVIFAATIIGCCGTCCAKPTSVSRSIYIR